MPLVNRHLSSVSWVLFDHSGTLLINGRPVEHYDAASLHRRTSCLFQDFGRYNFTLRENVGIGNLEHVSHDEELQTALELGGADSVRQKVGWNGRLDRLQVPNIAEEDQMGTGNSSSKQNGGAITAKEKQNTRDGPTSQLGRWRQAGSIIGKEAACRYSSPTGPKEARDGKI